MTEAVLELAKSLCDQGTEEETLRLMCATACQTLDHLLLDGVTAEDCGDSYKLAAAWMVMDWLKDSQDWAGVTALSAGDLTVRRESGQKGSGRLSHRAMELMAPYIRDHAFVFRGVRG